MTRIPSPVLEITEDIIASAEKRHSGHCMIAETVKNAVPDASYISVDLATTSFTILKDGLRYTYLTPAPAQAALVNFDQGNHTEPFTVRLKKGVATTSGRVKKKGATKATLVPNSSANHVPTRAGGKPPPKGALRSGGTGTPNSKDKITGVGSRRSFGIKNLKL